jgi:hypothetical protein
VADFGIDSAVVGRDGRYSATLTEMASEWPDAPELVYNQAQALRRLGGRRKEAIALYEQYIAQVKDADSVMARRLLAELTVPGRRP